MVPVRQESVFILVFPRTHYQWPYRGWQENRLAPIYVLIRKKRYDCTCVYKEFDKDGHIVLKVYTKSTVIADRVTIV